MQIQPPHLATLTGILQRESTNISPQAAPASLPRPPPGIIQTPKWHVVNKQNFTPMQTYTISPLLLLQPLPRDPQPCPLLWTVPANTASTVGAGIINSQSKSQHPYTNIQCPGVWDMLLAGRWVRHPLALHITLRLRSHWWGNLLSLPLPNSNRLAPGPTGTP